MTKDLCECLSCTRRKKQGIAAQAGRTNRCYALEPRLGVIALGSALIAACLSDPALIRLCELFAYISMIAGAAWAVVMCDLVTGDRITVYRKCGTVIILLGVCLLTLTTMISSRRHHIGSGYHSIPLFTLVISQTVNVNDVPKDNQIFLASGLTADQIATLKQSLPGSFTRLTVEGKCGYVLSSSQLHHSLRVLKLQSIEAAKACNEVFWLVEFDKQKNTRMPTIRRKRNENISSKSDTGAKGNAPKAPVDH